MLAVRIQHALAQTYGDVLRNHTLEMAAALSCSFVVSLFPALIFLSAVVAFLPVKRSIGGDSRGEPADALVRAAFNPRSDQPHPSATVIPLDSFFAHGDGAPQSAVQSPVAQSRE